MKIKEMLKTSKKELGEIDITNKHVYLLVTAIFEGLLTILGIALVATAFLLYYLFAGSGLFYVFTVIFADIPAKNYDILLFVFSNAYIYFPFLLALYYILGYVLRDEIYNLRNEREKEEETPIPLSEKGTYTIKFHKGEDKTITAPYYIIRDNKVLFRERKGPFNWPSTILSIPFEEIKSIEGIRNFKEIKQEGKD